MKKLLCFLLCSVLIFSSVSLCFATAVDWDSSDSQHLTEIRNTLMSGGSIYNLINAINSNVVNLNSNLVQLMGWLDPSTGGSTTALLNRILSMLSYTDTSGALKSWLADIWQQTSLTQNNTYALTPSGMGQRTAIQTSWNGGGYNQTFVTQDLYTALLNDLNQLVQMTATNSSATFNKAFWQQNYVDWTDLSSDSFTPISTMDGFYSWLSTIQAPVARLSYVLASDERIAAQESAAANEEAVVDNFIDSTGDGSASPSDIGSVSDLSSGYKQNFGTDASPSGIFDIFNSDHATWFSQETKNQLDTTEPSRMTKGSVSETPLLDKQIEDIYDALGVKQP